eukprot:529028-Pyramimonas_sp.AAC.1
MATLLATGCCPLLYLPRHLLLHLSLDFPVRFGRAFNVLSPLTSVLGTPWSASICLGATVRRGACWGASRASAISYSDASVVFIVRWGPPR